MPSDIVILLLPNTLCELWQRTDVSDSHVDRSHRVCPAAPCALYVWRPKLAPFTVKLTDPVEALLGVRCSKLILPSSID